MNHFPLLIKPVSSDCNLRCEYCFYLGKGGSLYPGVGRHRMNNVVLESLIGKYMATDQPVYTFIWQGGEPTLMGPEFFKTAVNLQKLKGRKGARVANLLQTNCTNISPELIAVLKEYKFLLGVSLDGPQDLHDSYRRTPGGIGTHSDVVKNIGVLKANGVAFNALTLVTTRSVSRTKAIYDHLCDLGIYHHQYIPCLERDGGNELMPYSLSGKEWGRFLCQLFDIWSSKDINRVSIRFFEAVISLLVFGKAHLCHMESSCCQYLVIEYNGDVFPCDFYVYPELKLGNILDDRFEDLFGLKKHLEFGNRKSTLPKKCERCKWLSLCFGDCPKHRKWNEVDGISGRTSMLCSGHQIFFEHAIEPLQRLASKIRAHGLSTRSG